MITKISIKYRNIKRFFKGEKFIKINIIIKKIKKHFSWHVKKKPGIYKAMVANSEVLLINAEKILKKLIKEIIKWVNKSIPYSAK